MQYQQFAKAARDRIGAVVKFGLCLFLAVAAEILPTAPKASPLIFLSPVTDQVTPKGISVNPDYQQLFQPEATWQQAMSRVHAFEVPGRYVFAKDEATLRNIFAFLTEHHIALAVIFGLVPSVNGCGKGIEGMVGGEYNRAIATRLKQLGGDLKYIISDEPLTFGHYFNKNNACQYSFDVLAESVANEAEKVRSIYPNAQIIEEEADTGVGTPEELGIWLDTLRRQMGKGAPISIRMDIEWRSHNKPWWEIAPPLVQTVLRHGYNYGIIYDGDPQDPSDAKWIHSAQGHAKEWEAVVHSAPDHVAIASWHHHPERVLPETSPTLPYLVNWYHEHSSGNSN